MYQIAHHKRSSCQYITNMVRLIPQYLVLLFFAHGTIASDIQREFFLDGSCSREKAPLHALVLNYVSRSDLEPDEYHVPSTDMDCFITFNSPTFTDGITRKISIKARNSFSVQNPFTCTPNLPAENCLDSQAYMQVFYGGGTDTGKTLELVGTYCNKVPFSYMEAPEKYRSVTVRLVVKGSYNMSLVNSPVTITPPPTTTPLVTPDPVTVSLTSDGITESIVEYDPTKARCGVSFAVDITHFIVGKCNLDGNKNNKRQFYCKEEDKCISSDLVCDWYLSNNCGNYADNLAGPPSRCGTRQAELRATLLPVWIILGALIGLALLYWCFWRPGWLVWRLGFLRNCCYDTSLQACTVRCGLCCCRRCTHAAAERIAAANGGARETSHSASQRGSKSQMGHTKPQKSSRSSAFCCGVLSCCSCCKSSEGEDKSATKSKNSQPANDAGWEEFFSSGGFHLRRFRN